MENKDENRNFHVEQNCVSGVLYVTIDRKLICLEKFKEHIKLEVIFDQTSSTPDACNLKQESDVINDFNEDTDKEDSLPNTTDKYGDDELPVSFQIKDQESLSKTGVADLEGEVKSTRRILRKRKVEHYETDYPCTKKEKLSKSKLKSKAKSNSKKRGKSYEMKIQLKSQSGSRKSGSVSPKGVVKNERKSSLRVPKEVDRKSVPNEDVSCPHCKRVFSSRQKLSEHLHIKGNDYKCEDCAKYFQLWAHYLVHQKVHHNKNIPISPEGLGVTDTSEKNPLFALTESKGKTYKCNICGIQLQLRNLKKHIWTHTNENVFQCCVCDTQTRYLANLKSHLRVHSLFAEMASLDPSKNIDCDLKEWTGKTEGDIENLVDGQLVDEKREAVDGCHNLTISCFYCRETFKGEQAFKNHCLLSTGCHLCEVCGKNFKYHSEYLVHRKLVHGIEFPVSQAGKSSRSFSLFTDYNGLNTFRCDICDIGIESIDDLNVHMRQHICQYSYKCCVCKVVFSYFDDFTNHLASHPINKSDHLKMDCSFCLKKFALKQDYTAHHEVQSPTFVCETCNEAQKTKAHLIVHTNIVHEMHIPLSLQTDANGSCSTGFAGQLVGYVEKSGDAVNSYKCNVCSFITKDLKILGTHVMKHTGEFAYKCCVCGVEERDRNSFNYHLASHKKGKRKLKDREDGVTCPFCSETFKNKNDLDLHYKLEMDNYACIICSRTFQYKAYLLTHCNIFHKSELPPYYSDGRFSGILCAKEKTHAGSVAYRCNICDKNLSSPRILRRHMLQHTDENVYKCCICDFKHGHLSNFKRHQSNHRKPNCFKCKQCGDYFRTRKELSRHQFTHKLLCELCGETFENNPSRNYHIKVYHKNDSRLLKCDQCERLYTTEKALEAHKMRHRFSKRVQCPECGIFVTRLVHHMKCHSKSPHSFACDKCPRTFRDENSFERHMVSHSQLKRFSCPQCHKKFPSSGALTNHLKIHLGEKPYVCEICGKACNARGNLQIHMRVHNKKPKLFRCTNCGLDFTRQKDLQEHVDLEHKKDLQPVLINPPEPQPHYFQAGVDYQIYY